MSLRASGDDSGARDRQTPEETITAERGDLGEVQVVAKRADELVSGDPDDHRPNDGDDDDIPPAILLHILMLPDFDQATGSASSGATRLAAPSQSS
ncbi:MAG TPA: hypothetical protein VF195_00335 [Actinomycetota bacterium]